MVISVLSVPLGGVAYFVFGRVPSKREYRRGYEAASAALSRSETGDLVLHPDVAVRIGLPAGTADAWAAAQMTRAV
jgi:hypothetical protein